MRLRSAAAVAILLALGACASPASRISTALVRYGLDEQRADCVGSSLQQRLSLGQLQRLGAAARAYREGDSDPTRLTPSDLLRVAGELRDPEIPLAVGQAGLACGVVPAL